MRRTAFVFLVSGVLLAGCGSSGDDDTGDDDDDDIVAPDADPSAPDADPSAPDASPGDWVTLLTGDWNLPAGTESYTCVYVTVDQDVWFDGVEAIAPLGTHHTVLSMGPPQHADGVVGCTAVTNYNSMLYASGVGTDPFTFPEGVAMHVPAGNQLLLNLHLFNFSDTPLTGTSGNRVRTVNPADVQYEAASVLAGKALGLIVPPGESTSRGTCNMTGDTNIFAMIPHMHMLGTHMKVTLESSDMGNVVIHDQGYSFDQQFVDYTDPIVPMKAGDRMLVDCTYNNTTGGTVYFGDSSLAEMCFAITFRYPPVPGGYLCAN